MSISPATISVLRECRSALTTARESALSAQTGLAGVRKARAAELAEKIADAIAFADRLFFVVQSDQRAGQ
ncbi:hypothetical protein [Mycobacterium sp. 852002-10029_SCH5224772]|jgi:hypothetical protein|uniref:hypothetical protein n=1 Tax=Mycobacterium sp. 852002-10029_SCH5224772 TaxID=1834083 RepID=UPI000801FA03|nr:hypothetical protein [Mycobacterium sp. 852002-10029_SCH5224772]OBF09577.1 hypothetical protein A5775_20115 [Mycobacterium sp. 852002-10029_SCH5224772]